MTKNSKRPRYLVAIAASAIIVAACEPQDLQQQASVSSAVDAKIRGATNNPPTPPPEQQPGADGVISNVEFEQMMTDLSNDKPDVMKRQLLLLNARYDLSDRGDAVMTMSRGKKIQRGTRAFLPDGMTWQKLAEMSPEEIRDQNLFPLGFLPLPHPKQSEGGMVFPESHIKRVLEQSHRRLDRFDVEFDIPEIFLAESPAAIYLTTRPDLGDVSQGQLVTQENFYSLFWDKLPPKQLDGLRLLVTPFPERQFNLTNDRRVAIPQQGVSCFDCHANGHTNGATHLVGDIRPQEIRNRLDTPTLRGVNIQRLFGSQRSLRSIEDFTEFEQRGAYFDSDPGVAARIGINFLDRGGQVLNMAEFQEMLDFPPAPKLGIDGKLNPQLASQAEMRGQNLFFGKAQCFQCHAAPYYTDNLTHDLHPERFYKTQLINGQVADADGPIKTFPLRGIKDSPPYLHDGRLLTLDDTVDYFNLILELHLNPQEKSDLVEFMLAL